MKKLLQVEVRAGIERIGTEQWVTVYSTHRSADDHGGYFCAVVPEEQLPDVMGRDTWELMIGKGLPGFSQHLGAEELSTTYHRFGGDAPVEPRCSCVPSTGSSRTISSCWRNSDTCSTCTTTSTTTFICASVMTGPKRSSRR